MGVSLAPVAGLEQMGRLATEHLQSSLASPAVTVPEGEG